MAAPEFHSRGAPVLKRGHILIVDDEARILNTLEGILTDEGYEVSKAQNGDVAMQIVRSANPDLVILDIWMPGMDGIEALQAMKQQRSDIEVVMMSGHGSIDTAVKATKLGAFDFVEKPLSLENLLSTVSSALEHRMLKKGVARQRNDLLESYKIIGENPKMGRARGLMLEAASADLPILILGEDGSGKEFIARNIHERSRHGQSSFLKVSCSMLQKDSLCSGGIQALLAKADQKTANLELSHGGTIFLDEVENLSPKDQLSLYRLFGPLRKGSKDNGEPGKMRLIAASAADLADAASRALFSALLLNIFKKPHILIPPLRERRDDIPLLVRHFLAHFSSRYGKNIAEIEDQAMAALVNYIWPGNVKELKNIIERTVITCPMDRVTLNDLPSAIRGELFKQRAAIFEGYGSLSEAHKAWEKEYLLFHLKKNNWELARTAAELKVSAKGLERKIKWHGLMPARVKGPGHRYQRTLRRSVVLCGQGLHSGLKTGLILLPLPPNSGIVFGDISTGVTIPASIEFVDKAGYATSLRHMGILARTIEHLMAVLHIYGISNLLIKINDEVPIMDGSARDFCQLIEDGGIEEQEAPMEELVMDKTFSLGDRGGNGKFIKIEPCERLTIDYTLDYPFPIGNQRYIYEFSGESDFKMTIAPSRTFGFVRDFEKLEQQGLASGGRLDNVILVDDQKVINTKLRFPDEFVRHKILDIIGDFYLLGKVIVGKITAVMTGHAENIELLRKIKRG